MFIIHAAHAYLVIHATHIYTCYTENLLIENKFIQTVSVSVCLCTYSNFNSTNFKIGKGMGNGTEARTSKGLGKFWDERSSAKMLLRP